MRALLVIVTAGLFLYFNKSPQRPRPGFTIPTGFYPNTILKSALERFRFAFKMQWGRGDKSIPS